MIAYICLYWIGMQLNAPTWFNVLVFIGMFFRIWALLSAIYKAGVESAN